MLEKCPDLSDSMNRIMPSFPKTAKKYLKAAEELKPHDPHLVALAAYEEAVYIVAQRGGWNYNEVEALVEKGAVGMKGCKKWVPKILRETSFDHTSEMAEGGLKAGRDIYPTNYRDVRRLNTDQALVAFMLQRRREVMSRPREASLHTCNTCGVQHRDMSCCSSCKKTWYCNKKCQVAHWKAGHKTECGKS